MSQQVATAIKGGFFRSLFFKCVAMVALCVIVVVLTLEVHAVTAKQKEMRAHLETRGQEVTKLLATQVGGAIKFSDTGALATVVSDVVGAAGSDATGGVITNLAGGVLYATPDATIDLHATQTLARLAIETGAVVVSRDRLSHAYPARFGVNNDVIGATVTHWDDQYRVAELRTKTIEDMALGGAILVAALAAAGWYLWSGMSQPLRRLERAMAEVANAQYDVTIPHVRRRDEVGQIARCLDVFRQALCVSHQAARESAFKGAAFSGSSAAMMMVDGDMNITFVNPACTEFLAQLPGDLADMWPDGTTQNLVGVSVEHFDDLAKLLAATNDNTRDGNTASRSLQIGDRIIEVRVNRATDSDAQNIGAVVEWADRTEEARNAALIATIDSNQVRIEFLPSGAVFAANSIALDLAGVELDLALTRCFENAFGCDLKNDKSADAVRNSVLSGVSEFGRYEYKIANQSAPAVLEGVFTPVTNPGGTLERIVFLGTDVTEAEGARSQAETDRARIEKEQAEVVGALGTALNALSNGVLTTEIGTAFPQEYEKLRNDFNATTQSLRHAMGVVANNAQSIRAETSEITNSADDLSNRTERQAATLEETAAALDELTASVRSAAEGADDANKISTDAKQNAEEGGEVARQAVKAMDEIKTSSQEISKITSVIDDIAFQTNLLALNAGVEAARAGEAGRGFAVVATEVRALALRSSDAAREINALISSSSEQVQLGVDLVDRTGEALAAILGFVAEINKRVSTIAASAKEQSTGLVEINQAITELDSVTQQNAAMFEETTAASHALTSEADALAAAMSKFQMGKEVANDVRAAPKPKPVPAPKRTVPESALPASRTHVVTAAASVGNRALSVAEETDLAADWEEF